MAAGFGAFRKDQVDAGGGVPQRVPYGPRAATTTSWAKSTSTSGW
jgi:hypothetical protein